MIRRRRRLRCCRPCRLSPPILTQPTKPQCRKKRRGESMRRRIAILSLLLVVLAAAACATPATPGAPPTTLPGTPFVPAATPAAAGELSVTLHRSGGIAGANDTFVLKPDGSV